MVSLLSIAQECFNQMFENGNIALYDDKGQEYSDESIEDQIVAQVQFSCEDLGYDLDPDQISKVEQLALAIHNNELGNNTVLPLNEYVNY